MIFVAGFFIGIVLGAAGMVMYLSIGEEWTDDDY